MVRPYRDLFCFVPKGWKSTINWQTIFINLPFSSQLRGYGPVRHIAVEFESSWNLNWPKDLYDLLDEPTARGFVARAVKAYASKEMELFIWLIDRCPRLARRKPSRTQKTVPKVFYDCDQEYIETELVQCMPLDEEQFSQTAAHFVYRLDILGSWEYSDMAFADTLSGDGYHIFEVEDCLGILTCGEFRDQDLHEARGSRPIV